MHPKILTCLLVFLTLFTVGDFASAYPTSCNIIPTADILAQGRMRLEYENDGAPQMLKSGSISYLYSQFGISPKFEFGADHASASGDSRDSLNAKYLVLNESKKMPALAIGFMDMAQGSNSTLYGVATKTCGKTRLHAGLIHADYSKGLMLGLDRECGKDNYLLVDWMAGGGNFLTFGLYREWKERWALRISHGFPNASGAEQTTAINVAWFVKFSK